MSVEERQSAVVRLNAPTKLRRPARRTFICMGVVRGGTSAVGGLMQRFGIFMGENLTNNYEDRSFLGKPMPEMKKTVAERNAAHDIWGWKNPHASNYLDVLLPDLRAPHLIVVYRDLVATMRAHSRWHNRTDAHAAHEILLMYHRNWFLIERVKLPTLMVSYEKLILQPELFTSELADFIGVPSPQGDDMRAAAEFLAPGSYK